MTQSPSTAGPRRGCGRPPCSAVDEGFAEAIGLSRTAPDEPGILRRRCGRGFTFRWPDGSIVRGDHRARCEALAVPPAWDDVWVSQCPDGHLQAVGTDDAGRRQYRYHDRWSEARTAAKFDRLLEVGQRLGNVRRRIAADMDGDDVELRAVAAMVRLIDQTLERVGNRSSVTQFGTRGISTLGERNVDIDGPAIRLAFAGKGGVDHDLTIRDGELAETIGDLEEAGTDWLFDVGGATLTAADANAYLAETSD